jgi:predicted ATPase
LSHNVGDTLVFAQESLEYNNHQESQKFILGNSYKETELKTVLYENNVKATLANSIRKCLSNLNIFHFHDTSKNALIKQARAIEDNSNLKSDGGNLASFLYHLKEDRWTPFQFEIKVSPKSVTIRLYF